MKRSIISLVTVAALMTLLSGCFPKKAGGSLSHFHVEAPAVGTVAPNFQLADLNGDIVELKDLFGEKPIVLQLGSHTCPVYRYRRFGMRKLYADYKDKAHFLLVYTLEAHPVGAINPYVDREWVSSFNYITNTLIEKHSNYAGRKDIANFSVNKLEVPYPVVIDNMNDAVWKAYGRAPSAAFVIDQSGVIALQLPWVDPKPIANTLDELLLSN